MNKAWSDLNKSIQNSLKKEITFHDGIKNLLQLRDTLFHHIMKWKDELKRDMFDASPFINSDGYHNKTIAYALWHIFRIEDIVTHSLIKKNEQIFFSNQYQKRLNSKIITTGNELSKSEIIDFSKELDLNALYEYIKEVKDSTDHMLRHLTYKDLKIKMTEEDKKHLESLFVVSQDNQSNWLLNYWCQKDIRGLIQMPLTRHWIMHVEASIRIIDRLKKTSKNGL